MSLQKFLRYLANGQIVDELANTPIVRRSAQLTHYLYQRGINKLNDITKGENYEEKKTDIRPPNLSSFKRTFAKTLKKEIEKEMKK